MKNIDLLNYFKSNLENLIKSCLEKELYIESDEFHIAADYATHCKLNNIMNSIGLEVYGMRITQSEFEITFQFIGAYEELQITINAPKYCHISFNNDGNYDLVLRKSDLSHNLLMRITDSEFNKKKIGEDKFDEILKAMIDTLIVYHIKR